MPGIVLIVSMALGLFAGLGSDGWTVEVEATRDIIEGRWAAAYETTVEDSLRFREVAIEFWGALQYLAFREGQDGVRVGSDGWLYLREEFVGGPEEAALIERDASEVATTAARLRALGIELLVMSVPTKTQVHEDHLGRWRRPAYIDRRYEAFHEALEREGVAVANGLEALTRFVSETPSRAAFFRTDTHWTPDAAAHMAFEAAAVARELGLAPATTASFETQVGEPLVLEGDLLRYVRTSWLPDALEPAEDTYQPRTTQSTLSEDEPDLFGAVSLPIAIVGTSYSADPRWNVAGALQQSFGADVLDLADSGRGPFDPMREALETGVLLDASVQLVIWEIPIRYVAQPHVDPMQR